MHPDITRALDAVNQAEKELELVSERIQRECKHERVLHADYKSHQILSGGLFMRRICLGCGLEEESKGFASGDYSFSKLKTNGFHKVVSHEELWMARI